MAKSKLHVRNFKKSLIPEDLDLSNRFCPRPFEHFEILHGVGENQEFGFGDVYACCPGWLPKKIGNYLENDLQQVWNSKESQEIRKSILDGSFKFCNKQACVLIQSNNLYFKDNLPDQYKKIVQEKMTRLKDLPTNFFLCYDRSCNLACKSCRNGLIFFNKGLGYENPLRLNEKILSDLFSQPHDKKIVLKITGSGDPFASFAFRKLLSSIDGSKFPNLQIDLFTNGVLLNKLQWQKLAHLHQNIKYISISIDAATPETYKTVRKANWDQLMNNLDFVASLRAENKIRHFATNYVVQTKNYHEVADFVRLCQAKQVDEINFSFISDWGTWDKDDFQKQSIWRKDHPQFNHFLQILKDPVLESPIAVLGALTSYRNLALSK